MRTGKDNIVDVLDWRCTTKPASAETGKPNKTYIHLLKWPNGIFELTGMKSEVTKAYLLADLERKPLKFKQKNGNFSVVLPETAPGKYVNVLCIETN